MKHKVSELEGALLDAAVAKANGWEREVADGQEWWWSVPPSMRGNPANAEARVHDSPHAPITCQGYAPSRQWSEAGPIIEREWISLEQADQGDGMVYAYMPTCELDGCTGPTPLIAAMRAFCVSKLGEEVEL